METYTQLKWLKATVAILVLLNLGIIGFGVWDRTQRPPFPPDAGGGPANFDRVTDLLKTELKLSPQQVQELADIHAAYLEKHHMTIMAMRQKRDSMNIAIFSPKIDTVLFNDLAARVTAESNLTERYRLEQAQKFRSILTPEQETRFLAIANEVEDYFKPHPRRSRPPRRD